MIEKESKRARIEPIDMITLRKFTRRNIAHILWIQQSIIEGANDLRGTKVGNEPTINVAITRKIRHIVSLYKFPDLDKRNWKELETMANLGTFSVMQSHYFLEKNYVKSVGR